MTTTATTAGSTASEFRHGLPALIFATVGVAVGVAGLPQFLGTLIVPLEAEFGWNRGEIAMSNLWSSIGLAIMLPFAGLLADRRGVRLVCGISIPVFALLILSLAFFNGPLALFLATYGLIGAVGAGTSAVIYTKVVTRYFDRARGLALGILAAGLGSAALIYPLLMGWAIATWGWRSAYVVMAVLAAIPLLGLFVLREPEGRRERGATAVILPGLTRREAVRDRAFWTLLVTFFLLGWALVSMVPHFVPMLIDSGVDPVRAAALSSLVGVGTLIARPVIGWLIDRVYALYVGIPMFLLAAVGILFLLYGGPALAPLTAVLIGVAFGAEVDLVSYLSSRYLGQRSFGLLYGIIYSGFSLGAAFGPVVAGYIFAAQGSYNTALIVSFALVIVSIVLLLTLPRYDRDRAERVSRISDAEPADAVSM